jgi:hypothetical protein
MTGALGYLLDPNVNTSRHVASQSHVVVIVSRPSTTFLAEKQSIMKLERRLLDHVEKRGQRRSIQTKLSFVSTANPNSGDDSLRHSH